ncbi:MAG: phosphodiester glycosidase family protein [Stappiaceae bacterium]
MSKLPGPVVFLSLLAFFVVVAPRGEDNAAAQEEGIPERAREMLASLEDAHFGEVKTGFSVLNAQDGFGNTRLTAWKVDPEKFRFQLVESDVKKGSHASWFLDHTHGLLAVNAGYFARNKDGSIYPVGFLKIDGTRRSSPWNAGTGGLLSFSGKEMSIHVPLPSKIDRSAIRNGLQSKPVMIEPGGKWAMRSNREILKNRTAVCLLPDKNVLIVTVSGRGLSLYELAVLMKKPDEDGFFGCEAAIALDGGSSTQVAYALDPTLNVASLAPVQNALVVLDAE